MTQNGRVQIYVDQVNQNKYFPNFLSPPYQILTVKQMKHIEKLSTSKSVLSICSPNFLSENLRHLISFIIQSCTCSQFIKRKKRRTKTILENDGNTIRK